MASAAPAIGRCHTPFESPMKISTGTPSATAAAPTPESTARRSSRARHAASRIATAAAGAKAIIVVLTSSPAASTRPTAAPRFHVSPRRSVIAIASMSPAVHRSSALSTCTPPAMNPNTGWNAAARAPSGHAQRDPGNSSRMNRKVHRTVAAASRAENARSHSKRSSTASPVGAMS